MMEEEEQEGLVVAQGADMCSLHKTLGVGGGMKVKTFACYCCSVHRNNLATPLDNPCEDCIWLGRMQPCFHISITDEGLIERLKGEREDHLRTWPHLQHLPYNGQSRLQIGNDGMKIVLDPASDNLHIEYEPNTRLERVAYCNLLEKELHLRNLDFALNQTTPELKIYLHEVLLIEKSFLVLDSILNATNLDEAMIRVKQAVPCLLHLKNRPSESIIEHLLWRGLWLVEGDDLATKELIAGVEAIMNQEIFGSIGCSYLWTFPINENGTMGKIKFANWRARRVIGEIVSIINICIPGEEGLLERNKWQATIDAYQRMIKVQYSKPLIV
jgi:hypothetical protein